VAVPTGVDPRRVPVARLPVALAHEHMPAVGVHGRGVLVHGREPLEVAHFHALAPACAQCGQGPDEPMQACLVVSVEARPREGLAVGLPVQVEVTPQRVIRECVGAPARVGARRAEGRDLYQHALARIAGEGYQGVRSGALDDDLRGAEAAFEPLGLQGRDLLAGIEVEAQRVGLLICVPLEARHLGAELGKELARVRAGRRARDLDDPKRFAGGRQGARRASTRPAGRSSRRA
jgi:hypothetical protein